MSTGTLRLLSNLCFFLGFASIGVSIAIWAIMRDADSTFTAHGERTAIFVGLWAPTFFALSDRFDRYATQRPSTSLT